MSEYSRGRKAMTKEEFITKAEEVHKGKYDYSHSEYVDRHTEIRISCTDHGEFTQTPAKHLVNRYGCPKCRETMRFSTHLYSKELNLRFPSVVDAAAYIGREPDSLRKAIKDGRTCGYSNITGERLSWEVATSEHDGKIMMSKQECRNLPSDTIKSKTYFSRVAAIHNGKYDYSKAVYTGSRCRITIICPKHGEFTQTTDGHVKCGCPACYREKAQHTAVSVHCPQLKRTFASIREVSRLLDKPHTAITTAIKKGESCGTHPETGEPLFWMTSTQGHPHEAVGVYCAELGMKFHSITAAAAYIGRTKSAVSQALKTGGSCGQHPETGTKLTWVRKVF
jgi:hypothetical protein